MEMAIVIISYSCIESFILTSLRLLHPGTWQAAGHGLHGLETSGRTGYGEGDLTELSKDEGMAVGCSFTV